MHPALRSLIFSQPISQPQVLNYPIGIRFLDDSTFQIFAEFETESVNTQQYGNKAKSFVSVPKGIYEKSFHVGSPISLPFLNGTLILREGRVIKAGAEFFIKFRNFDSVVLEYQKGMFEKTLLTSVAEYEMDDQLFDAYEFDYYNTLNEDNGTLELWSEKESWQVPKDNIDINPVTATSATDFLKSPTILGGAKSNNVDGALSVTIGWAVGNPATKENTIGGNGGGGTSNGSGVTTLVDIDGDGLPDKLWKENGILYYRKNLKRSTSRNRSKSPSKLQKKHVSMLLPRHN